VFGTGDDDRAIKDPYSFWAWEDGVGDKLRGGVGVEDPDEAVE